MINANFEYSGGSKPYLILSVNGHAGAGDIGHDIVCASCSILSYTLAQAVLVMESEGKLRKTPKTDIEDGSGRIVVKPKEAYIMEALHYFYMAYVGFTLLHENYPQFVGNVPFTGLPDKDKSKESLA